VAEPGDAAHGSGDRRRSGAIPLFWLGRKHLPRERDAALLPVAYLICPTVTWDVVSDFHTIAFAVPLLLFAIWFLDEDRLLPFAVTAGAATLCQERVGLIVGCLGLWYAWRHRRLGAGVAIAAVGFAISAVDLLVVIPHFSGGSPYAARFGGAPSALLADLFTHPLRLADQIGAHDLLGLILALPVLGYCFGSTILLAASPQIALLVLSRRFGDWDPVGINVLVLISRSSTRRPRSRSDAPQETAEAESRSSSPGRFSRLPSAWRSSSAPSGSTVSARSSTPAPR
jgi:hypothetical protein